MKLKSALLAGVAALLLPAGAYAAGCSTLTPVSGDIVDCTGTETGTIAAAPGSSNVTINVDSTGMLTAAHPIDSLYTDSTINNEGSILGTDVSGDAIVVRGENFVLNNNGTIDFTANSATTTSAALDLIQNADGAVINNTGSITAGSLSSGSGEDIAAIRSNFDITVVNSGLIQSSAGGNATAISGSQGSSVTNSGTIRAYVGDGGNAIAIDLTGTLGTAAPGATVTNLAGGVIQAPFSSIGYFVGPETFAIRTGAGNDTVINAGTISGGVDLGDGNDLLVLKAGTIITPSNGGAGNDTLRFDGSTSGTVNVNFLPGGDAILFKTLYDFETTEKTGSGTITYTGIAVFHDFFVREGEFIANDSMTTGNLTVDSGATLLVGGGIKASAATVQSGATLSISGGFSATTLGLESGATFSSSGYVNVSGAIDIGPNATFSNSSVNSYTAPNSGVINAGSINVGSGAAITNGHIAAITSTGAFNIGSNVSFNNGGTVTAPSFDIGSGVTIKGSGYFYVPAFGVPSGVILAPGNSIGTLHFYGNVNFAAGSIYEVEADPTHADLVSVIGNVTIANGAQLRVTTLNPSSDFNPSTTYHVVTASGTVTGDFTALPLAFFTTSLVNTGSGIDLTLDRNSVQLTGIAQTPNQQAVAASLEPGCASALPDTDLLDVCQAMLLATTPEAQSALDSISGAGLSQWPVLAMDAVTLIGQSLDQRFRRGYGGAQANRGGITFFEDALASDVTIDHSSALPGLDAEHLGLVAGAEAALTDQLRLGLHGGYVQSDGDATGVSPVNFDADTWLAGAHLLYDGGPLMAQLRGAWAESHAGTRRPVMVAGLARTATASPDADFIVAAGAVARRFTWNGVEVTPELSAQYLRTSVSAYQETGADSLDLSVGDEDLNSGHVQLAATIARTFGQLTPYATAGVRGRFGDYDPQLIGTLSGMDPFTVAGESGGDFSGVLGAGVEGYLGPLELFAAYEGLVGGNTDAQGGRLGIRLAF